MNRLAASLVLVPSAAFAHPGNHDLASTLHLLTEPDHAALVGLAGLALALVIRKLWMRP